MQIENIQIWQDVTLQSYLLHNSLEFQAGQKRPAVIICPGGAYLGTSDREAEPVALRFAAQGYHTFVLRYTTYFKEWVTDFHNLPVPNEKSAYPQPLLDLAKAILTVREHAEEWRIDSEKIAVCGFSAGAHLAASLGVHWQSGLLRDRLETDNEVLKPNAVILGYPLVDYQLQWDKLQTETDEMKKGLWQVSSKATFGTSNPSPKQLAELSPVNYVSRLTPPTFLWHTADDDLVYAENSLQFAAALAKHKVPYELHVFESGVHGLSLADETTAGNTSHLNADCKIWFDLAAAWLRKQL